MMGQYADATYGQQVNSRPASPFGPADVRNLWRRFWAFVIDTAILTIGLSAYLFTIGGAHVLYHYVPVVNGSGQLVYAKEVYFASYATGTNILLCLIVEILYFTGLEWALAWTPGKFVCGIRVVSFNGNSVSFWQALLRNLLLLVDCLFGWLVGLISMLTNDRRQRLGDKAAGTLVVNRRSVAQGADWVGGSDLYPVGP